MSIGTVSYYPDFWIGHRSTDQCCQPINSEVDKINREESIDIGRFENREIDRRRLSKTNFLKKKT